MCIRDSFCGIVSASSGSTIATSGVISKSAIGYLLSLIHIYPLTHVVLRGAVSKHGNTTTNYHYEDLIRLHEMYDKMEMCIRDR